MSDKFQITEIHRRWIKNARRKYKLPTGFWENLIQKQEGRCALTDAKLFFDVKNGTPIKGGCGCHPLYAAVDHINPSKSDQGFQILSYDINDLKAHLPIPLFTALTKTREWKIFAEEWKKLSEKQTKTRRDFKNLISRGTPSDPCSTKTRHNRLHAI